MNQRKLAREKLLFRYTNALERGDFAAVEAILQEAQHDAELERMIAEINAALSQEMPKFSARPVLNNHRYNHKDSTMYQNPTFPRAADLSREKRFPYALAAAILAVVLVGGLLITAKFGFDHQGDNAGGASLQRESATVIASMTPSLLNPIRANATPTILPNAVNPAGMTATPIPSGGSIGSPTIPYYPSTSTAEEIVLCEVRALHHDLFSRPNGIISGTIEIGQVVQVLDITLGFTLYNLSDPSIANPIILWFFVRQPGTPVQGWLPSRYIELLSECPYPTDADYLPTIHLYATAVSSGAITLEPPVATSIAATAQAYYDDLSTASAQAPMDSDGDGISDMPSTGGTPPPTVASVEVTAQTDSNANGDSDGDGLTDADESILGTNPFSIDSDMDGVVDSKDQFPTDPSRSEFDITATPLPTMTFTNTPTPTMTPSVTLSPTPAFSPTPPVCSPINPTRMAVGDQGRVIGEGRTGVNLRDNYGFDAPLIRLLDAGTEFEVLDEYTFCDTTPIWGAQWFNIAIDGEEAGWIPETMWVINDGAASNVYVIEPLD